MSPGIEQERWLYLGPLFFLLLLTTFVAYPAAHLVWRSFCPSDTVGLSNYTLLFGDPYWRQTLWNSLGMACAASFCATLMGLVLATAVYKTRLRFRRIFMTAAVLPMILPGFVTSLAYIFLFGRNGLITYQWLGLSWQIYGWPSVLILQALGFTTTTFFLIAAAMVSVDPDLENAARHLGAGEWRVFADVVLPHIGPAVLAAALLSFLRSLADFGTPYIMGGKFNTLATASYTQLIGVYDTGLAATLNVVLLALSLAGFSLYARVRPGGTTGVLGRGGSQAPIRFHPLLKGILAAACWLFAVVIFALLLSVLLAAFTRHLGGNFALTLDHFSIIPQRGWNSIRNTLLFATLTSLVMTTLGLSLAYLVTRTRLPGMRLLDAFATLPFAIPGTFMGLSFALAFNRPPLVISGTWLIVVACTVVRELPVGLQAGISVLANQGADLEDAAANLGDGRLGRFIRIVLPLARPALLVSAFYAFIATSKTLGAIIFIISPGNKVLAADVFEATVRGDVGDAAAFSVVIMLVAALGVAAVYLFSRDRSVAWMHTAVKGIQG
jgi:iron(III) transport system permease protein